MPLLPWLLLLCSLPWLDHCDETCEEEEIQVQLLQSKLRLLPSTPSLQPVGRSFYSTDPASSANWWLRYSAARSLPLASVSLMGLEDAEAVAAVEVGGYGSDGPAEELYFLKAPSWRSSKNLTMLDFVRAAELSWDSVMSRQQGYNPWMDFHDGHKVQTMRLDHFKEDNYSFQVYLPIQDITRSQRVLRSYIPHTTWTIEWLADFDSAEYVSENSEFLSRKAGPDPDLCRGPDDREMREMWWKSTFAVTNASAARDFAIKVLGAIPVGQPYPWPPQPDCIAAQWVNLPHEGLEEWQLMQLHFVEDPVYTCALHDVRDFLKHQQEFAATHRDCIDSFMLNNFVLEASSLDPFVRRLNEASAPYFVSKVSGRYALLFSFPGEEGVVIQIRSSHLSAAEPKPLRFCA